MKIIRTFSSALLTPVYALAILVWLVEQQPAFADFYPGPLNFGQVLGNGGTTPAPAAPIASRILATGSAAFYVNGVFATTNATTAAGNNTLHFSATPSYVTTGATVSDNTAPVIPPGTTVLSTTSTTAVLSNNVTGAGVGNGDTITVSAPCGPTGAATCMPGSDSVTAAQAMSQATPFLTLRNAIAAAARTYDFGVAGNPIFYPAHCAGFGTSCLNYGGVSFSNPSLVGDMALNIVGDSNAPTAVMLEAPNNSTAIWTGHFNVVHLINVALGDQGSAIGGVWADEWAGIDLQNVTCNSFNSSAFCLIAKGFSHIECAYPNGGMSPITIAGNMGGIGDLYDQARWNCGSSGPNLLPASAVITIPSAVAFSIAGVRATGGVKLINFSSGSFAGSGVAGTTGIKALLTGPGFLFGNGAPCNSIFPGNSGCQITQGFQDDASDPNTWLGPHAFNIASAIASGASATLDDLAIGAATTTVTGSTNITTAKGFNKFSIYRPTLTAGSSLTVSKAASLYIDNAPLAAGSLSIAQPWAVNIGAGDVFVQGANETTTIADGVGGNDNATLALQRIVTSLNVTMQGLVVDVQNNNATASKVSRGISVFLSVPSGNSTAQGNMNGANVVAEYAGTGGVPTVNGGNFTSGNIGTGTATAANGYQVVVVNSGGGTITTSDGLKVQQPTGATTGLTSTWTNVNGVEILDQNPSGAGTNTLTSPPIAILIDSQTASGAYALKQNGSGLVLFNSNVSAVGGFTANGNTGLTQTCTVNQAKTLIFTLGILTGGSCNS
jgi:hypothetical protein